MNRCHKCCVETVHISIFMYWNKDVFEWSLLTGQCSLQNHTTTRPLNKLSHCERPLYLPSAKLFIFKVKSLLSKYNLKHTFCVICTCTHIQTQTKGPLDRVFTRAQPLPSTRQIYGPERLPLLCVCVCVSQGSFSGGSQMEKSDRLTYGEVHQSHGVRRHSFFIGWGVPHTHNLQQRAHLR